MLVSTGHLYDGESGDSFQIWEGNKNHQPPNKVKDDSGGPLLGIRCTDGALRTILDSPPAVCCESSLGLPCKWDKTDENVYRGWVSETCGMVFLFELEAIGADSEEVEREGNNLGAYNDLVTALPFLF